MIELQKRIEFVVKDAKYNLDSSSGSHAEETGKMLIGIKNSESDIRKVIFIYSSL